MLGLRGRVVSVLTLGGAVVGIVVPAANAAFPYKPGSPASDYSQYRIAGGADQVPADVDGKREWMYAATAHPDASPLVRNDPRELHGVRGAHVADRADVDQAWRTTTGRPDVTVAVLDSGIKWNDAGAMSNLRKKTRLTRAETPPPVVDRASSLEDGSPCAAYGAAPGGDERDLNRDGVFNIVDYACDARVALNTPKGVGPAGMLEPQDVLIAFSDGTDADGNGYVDDIVGWDFLDDDNDPFDDVQYGHGTGEAQDSAAEAGNGGDVGTCPNCMQIHLRVGTSFIADVNRFALATIYATDNDVEVVQEALGTLNKSRIGLDAVKYAYDHGTVVMASAADEAAQHHNWPSSYPYVIVANSVTSFDVAKEAYEAIPSEYRPPVPSAVLGAAQGSYLMFNGCTNFSSRITIAVPSVSCSSDAVGRSAGMAGLVYSAALNALESGALTAHPGCRRTNGEPCAITANEVRQIMASGTIAGTEVVDDVSFVLEDPAMSSSLEIPCKPLPLPACTDPFLSAPSARVTVPRSYPARKGHDQFYGYGRVNMNKAVDALVPAGNAPSRVPPEVEVTAPGWYDMADPAAASMKVAGQVWARGAQYACSVFVAPGSYPDDGDKSGDFTKIALPGSPCNGLPRSAPVSGQIAAIPMATLKALFPAGTNFSGREPGARDQTYSGRPNTEPYGFVVKVVATATNSGVTLTGEDRRQAYLHRDSSMLPGFPKQLPGDGEASPALADIDGDNHNELVLANSDGLVYAFERDGSQVPGFPAHTDPLPLHPRSRAFATGAVAEAYGAVLASPAVGDLDRDGALEIVVADLEGKVYVINGKGERVRHWQTVLAYAGVPPAPFENVRRGHLNRTQLGFLGSPVLADLDGDDGGRLEVVAAAMDRHVYAWNEDGTAVPGWPVLVVDRDKVAAIDPASHRVDFDPAKVPGDLDQGAIISTPAVGELDGTPGVEVVVGTNESYEVDEGSEGAINAGGLNAAAYAPLGAALSFANGRLFALNAEGEPDGDPGAGPAPWLPGWPFKVGILEAGILPLVGEGITGSPIIGSVPCGESVARPRVGVIPAAGVPYLVNADGQSCLGRENGLDVGLPTQGGTAADQPFLPAFGHPAFGEFPSGTAFLAPAAGLMRALDVVLPEYQGGHDYLVAWETQSGEIAPGWPVEVNDLQFLTGPSLANLNQASPGDEILAGTSSDDLQGLTSLGADATTLWPKLTGDWTVANPAIGTWGAPEGNVAVALTRSGRMLAYYTGAQQCDPDGDSWPRFHHDNANSGDYGRDAVSPGRPSGAQARGSVLSFTAPGDDLLCGRAASYDVRHSDAPITAASFAAADPLAAPVVPAAAGALESIALPATGVKRYVAVRAVDEQGSVGLPAVVDRG